MNIADLIPSSNILSVPAFTGLLKTNALEAAYSQSSFVGCFMDRDDQPTWARRVARWHRDEFRHDTPGKTKLFSDVKLADDAGKCHMNFRYALEAWAASGQIGVKPYSTAQDYGSCVDASASEHMTALLGWRAACPEFGEVYKLPAAWYWYADRGYCSDGWDGWSCATVALRRGVAFRQPYQSGNNKADFTDDDTNEQIVARSWCRSGIPSWMAELTKPFAFEDGAITEFDGDVSALCSLFAAGGILHTGGTRTSGGSKPFTVGSVGPHMQSAMGCDDSDEFRKFCKDVIGVKPRTNDFPVVFSQTWGPGWSGECANKYWPSWWGPKNEGAWVFWASDVLRYFNGDMFAWLPRVKGFPADNPVPPTPQPSGHPPITGSQYLDGTAIRGTLTLDVPVGCSGRFRYVSVPGVPGQYRLAPKPEL